MVCSSVQLVFLLICTSFISGHYTCLIENRRGWQVRVMGRVGGEVAWWNQSMRLLPSSLTLTGQRKVWSADIGAHIFTSFYAKPDVHHSEVRTQHWQLTNIKKMSMVSPTINWNKKSKFFFVLLPEYLLKYRQTLVYYGVLMPPTRLHSGHWWNRFTFYKWFCL